MKKGASVICVVREESESHMTMLSPFTFRPMKMYRAAGVVLEGNGHMLAATELLSLVVTPFDAADLDDLAIIQIEQPMIAEDETVERIDTEMEAHGMQSPLKEKMLIGAKNEHIRKLGRILESVLKDPQDLQKYLIQKYIENTYSEGSYGIRLL